MQQQQHSNHAHVLQAQRLLPQYSNMQAVELLVVRYLLLLFQIDLQAPSLGQRQQLQQ